MAPYYPSPSFYWYADNSATIKVDEPEPQIDPLGLQQDVLDGIEALRKSHGELKDAQSQFANAQDIAITGAAMEFYEDIIDRYSEYLADLTTYNQPS